MTIDKDYEKLTNQQKYVLSMLYKRYLENRKNGSSVDQSKYFGSIYKARNELFDNILVEDLQSYMNGLQANQFTNGVYGDGVYAEFFITDKTVVYFENKFKNNLKSVASFIKELKSFIF